MLGPENPEKILQTMLKAAERAGTVLQAFDRRHLTMQTKHGDARNIVTQADVASEAAIQFVLKQHSQYGILGEEGATFTGTAGTFFIDPLDGTIPYACGMPIYAISIGLVQNNTSSIGVLYYPHDRTLLHGIRGRYTKSSIPQLLNHQTIHNLVIGFDYSLGMNREEQALRYYIPLLQASRYVYTFACVTWAVRLLIEGKIDAYVHPGATRFDWAAAACILQEAGAVVCNFDGNPLDFSQERVPAIAARNQETMEEILKLYKHE